MKWHLRVVFFLFPLLLLSSGCEEDTVGGPEGGTTIPEVHNYFPLAEGAHWEYETLQEGGSSWEHMNFTHRRIYGEVGNEGEIGFLSIDSIGVGGDTPSQRYILRRNDGDYHRVTTLHFGEVTDGNYGPWYNIYYFNLGGVGSRWMETTEEGVTSHWELEDANATVTVQAGTFTGCRVNTWTTEAGAVTTYIRHYFVQNIGEVLEEKWVYDAGSLAWHTRMELVSYSLE